MKSLKSFKPFVKTRNPQGIGKPRYDRGVSRRSFEIVALVAIALAISTIVLAVMLLGGSTSDTQIHDILYERVAQEAADARTAAAQVSRSGGTASQQLLSQTRAHLYCLQMLNDMCTQLLKPSTQPVPQQLLNAAIEDINTCETLILRAQTIDVPLNDLWGSLQDIITAIEELES